MSGLIWGLIWLGGCAAPGSVSGTVTDARTGAAVTGLEVRWAAPEARAECRVRAATTDASGGYVAPDLCGGVRYRLELADGDWWAGGDPVEVSVDKEGARKDLSLWRIPAVGGLYLLDGTQLQALRTQSAIDRLPIPAGGEARFPLEIPNALPILSGERVVLLVGAEAQALALEPLIAAEARTLGTALQPQPVGPWAYLGLRFDGEAAEPVAAPVAPASLPEIGGGGRTARVLKAGDLPAGRYGFVTAGERRVAMVEVGE